MEVVTNNWFTKKYPIGFALSGGFIKGFAHLGAMQSLLEHDIKPNILSDFGNHQFGQVLKLVPGKVVKNLMRFIAVGVEYPGQGSGADQTGDSQSRIV